MVEAQPDRAIDPDPYHSQSAGRTHSLVVDDDATVRLLMREALDQLGLSVDEATDGSEAVELFNRLRPRLVLLDVKMPGMDGFSACAQLRRLPGGSDTTIVMVTGLDDYNSILRAYEVGATDFVTKPINWPILIQRVRYLLRAQDAFRVSRETEARLSEAQRIARIGNLDWDIASRRAYWSEETYRILGRSPLTIGATYEAFLQTVHPQDRASVSRAVVAALEGGERFSVEHRVLLPDQSERTVHSQGRIVYDEGGKPATFRGVIQDISERKEAEERIYRLSHFDELTGLPNRELFVEHAERALAESRRSGSRLALIYLDLDRFKRINDSLGRSTGDQVLKVAAERIAQCSRESDVVAKAQTSTEAPYTLARPGADEFMVLLSGLHRSDSAANFAQRVLGQLSQPLQASDHELLITASVGIAVHPGDGEEVEALLENADAALHHAKKQGGNCFRFYAAPMNSRALDRLSLEAQLNRALSQDQFELHFQPQTDLATGRMVGLEALLRWNSPDRGLVMPSEFIPIAEETGLILSIGEWVLHAACAQLEAWQRSGYAVFPVAVNLSARQFAQRDLVGAVRRALSVCSVEPQYLELELTESIIMRDAEQAREKLHVLKETGIRLAVDDFGTGYSSMSYLKLFPLDTLKIDRSFVQDLGSNTNDEAIVRAIIALGKGLELTTIAEGVETAEQRDILSRLGCERIQGYIVSRPLPAVEIDPLLASIGRAENRRLARDAATQAAPTLRPPADPMDTG